MQQPGSGSSNPFRRQKQQAKYQQKYQQQQLQTQGAGSGSQIAAGRQQSRGSAAGVNMGSSLAPYATGTKGKHQKHQTQLIGGQAQGALASGVAISNAQGSGSRDLMMVNTANPAGFDNPQVRGSQGRPQA